MCVCISENGHYEAAGLAVLVDAPDNPSAPCGAHLEATEMVRTETQAFSVTLSNVAKADTNAFSKAAT